MPLPGLPGQAAGATYLDGCSGRAGTWRRLVRGAASGRRPGGFAERGLRPGSGRRLGRKWCQPGPALAARRRGALGARLRMEVRGGRLVGNTHGRGCRRLKPRGRFFRLEGSVPPRILPLPLPTSHGPAPPSSSSPPTLPKEDHNLGCKPGKGAPSSHPPLPASRALPSRRRPLDCRLGVSITGQGIGAQTAVPPKPQKPVSFAAVFVSVDFSPFGASSFRASCARPCLQAARRQRLGGLRGRAGTGKGALRRGSVLIIGLATP